MMRSRSTCPKVVLCRGQAEHFQCDDFGVSLPEHVRPGDGPLSRMREAGKPIAVEVDSCHAELYPPPTTVLKLMWSAVSMHWNVTVEAHV